MTTMLQFMSRRERYILTGHLGHSRALTAKLQKNKRLECHAVAKAQARANPSDPFSYDRVMSYLLQGITLRGDYLVEWAKRQEESPFAALNLLNKLLPSARSERTVERPINRKIPTYC